MHAWWKLCLQFRSIATDEEELSRLFKQMAQLSSSLVFSLEADDDDTSSSSRGLLLALRIDSGLSSRSSVSSLLSAAAGDCAAARGSAAACGSAAARVSDVASPSSLFSRRSVSSFSSDSLSAPPISVCKYFFKRNFPCLEPI